MRVAVAANLDFAQPGGVEKSITSLTHALRNLNLDIDIYGRCPTPATSEQSIPILPITTLRPGDYDIIHTHGCSFHCRFLTFLIRRHHRPRHVHTLHGISLDYLRACRSWHNWRCYAGTFYEALLSRRAHHVITVSAFIKQRLSRLCRVHPAKVTVILNGFCPVDLPPDTRIRLRAELNIKPDDILTIFVGRGEDKVKGAPAILAALRQIRQQHPNVKLLVIPGPGFPDESWIIKTGPVPHQHMARYYDAADIFLNASLLEGCPLTLLEALSRNLPCIAAAVGGIPEIITHEHNGLLLQPDRHDLLDQLRRLVTDESLRERLGRNAAPSVAAYTWTDIARRTLAVYENVLNKSPA